MVTMRTRYTHFKTVLEVDRMVSTQERPFPSASCSEVILKVYPGIYFSFVCLFFVFFPGFDPGLQKFPGARDQTLAIAVTIPDP